MNIKNEREVKDYILDLEKDDFPYLEKLSAGNFDLVASPLFNALYFRKLDDISHSPFCGTLPSSTATKITHLNSSPLIYSGKVQITLDGSVPNWLFFLPLI